MSEYTRKAFYGFLWVAIGAFIANLFAYLLRLLLARSFTVAQYGLIYAIIAFFGLLSIFQHLGLGEALARAIASANVHGKEERVKEAVMWSTIIVATTALAVSAAMYLSAGWLSAAYFKDPAAGDLLRLAAVMFFIGTFHVIIAAILQGYQRLHLFAIHSTLQSLVLFTAAFIFISAGAGLASVMYAYISMYLLLYIVGAAFIVGVLRKPWQRRIRLDTANARDLLLYGFPVILTTVGGIVLTYTDTVLLTVFSTLEEVGIYQAALPTANILLFLVGVISAVLFPVVAEMWERKQKPLIAAAVQEIYKYSFILLLPLILGIISFPDIVLNLLFGPAYVAGAPVLSVLVLAAMFLVLNGVHAATLSGMGMPANNTKAVGAGAVLNLLLNLILIPRYGGLGAAVSTLVAAITIFVISEYYVRRELVVRLPLLSWAKTAVAGAGFLLVVWAARYLPVHMMLRIAIGLLLGIVAYAIILFSLRAVHPQEIRSLGQRIIKRG